MSSVVHPPNPHPMVRKDWLAQRVEEALEPDLPIVDPHHHLWDQPHRGRYLFLDLHEDLQSGHDVRATVFIECLSMYREYGEPRLRALGETEFANGAGAMAASNTYGPARAVSGIVGNVDLLGGDRAGAELEAHMAAAPLRFRGIRNISAWHENPAARGSAALPPPGLLMERSFREGFAHLRRLGLSFDAWHYHTQIPELEDLAGAFPDTPIVLNHLGGPIHIGPYADRRAEVFADWAAAIRRLAAHENVTVKIGGFGMKLFGFDYHLAALPPGSEQLARDWAPYVETCIEAFGVERCMFESNFPVDKGMFAYATCWNAYKRVAAGYSAHEKRALFSGTAARFYRLAGV